MICDDFLNHLDSSILSQLVEMCASSYSFASKLSENQGLDIWAMKWLGMMFWLTAMHAVFMIQEKSQYSGNYKQPYVEFYVIFLLVITKDLLDMSQS